MLARLWVAAAVAVLIALASPCRAQTPQCIPDKRIAIMNLKVSGEYADQVREWLPALIEDRLMKEGWMLVVRGERMDHIQKERNLGGLNPATKLPDNQIIGATAFVELSARVQVKDIQGIIGYRGFTIGDYARASVDLNGQIVDPATGLLKSSISVGGTAGGLKTAAVATIAKDWNIGLGGYNLRGIRESLVGKAADTAAAKMIAQLKALYPSMPSQPVASPVPAAKQSSIPSTSQLSSTTVSVTPSAPTILIDLPEANAAVVGDRYGVYRDDKMIAELEIVRLFGKRAEASILTLTTPIASTDTAKKIIVLKGSN